jgi:hypothetical protein
MDTKDAVLSDLNEAGLNKADKGKETEVHNFI